MMYFLLGLIIGLLLNPTRQKLQLVDAEIEKLMDKETKSEFFEPMSDKDKFISASNIEQQING